MTKDENYASPAEFGSNPAARKRFPDSKSTMRLYTVLSGSLQNWRHEDRRSAIARRAFVFFLLFTAFLLCSGRQSPAAAQEAGDTQPADRDPRFGVVEAFWSPEKAAELGAGWERILFYWSEIQPEGPDDWNTLHVLEEWLREADMQGRQIIGLLKHTPAWATNGPIYGGVPTGLYLPVDDPENLWAGYVRRIAEYYGPLGVHHWIIWNEPDIEAETYGNEFVGTVEDYYRMVKVASLVMKDADPEARIHLAGLTFWHDQVAGREQYLERFLRLAAADPEAAANDYFFDYISLHIYFRVETIPWIVERMDEIQRMYGLTKPIWINETNAAPTLDPAWPVERPEFTLDLEQQAWYLAQAYALGFASGAESIGVYKFSDVLVPPGAESFGLLRADFSERPAFTAYQTIIALLSGFENVWSQEHDQYWTVRFGKPDGDVRVMWARQPTAVTIDVPVEAGQVTLIGVTGETEPAIPEDGLLRLTLAGARCYDECIIGGPPVFVVEAHSVQQQPQTGAEIPVPDSEDVAGAPLPTPLIVALETATPFPTGVPTPATTSPEEPAGVQPGLIFLAAGGVSLVLLLIAWRALSRR